MTKDIVKPARHSGWEVTLVDTLSEQQTTPFAWGSSDCLTRIADLALAMTGVDPMFDVRGAYDSAATSAAVLKDLGFDDIEAALAKHFDPIEPAMARRGDCGIVLTEAGKREVKAGVIVMGDMLMGCALPSMPETDELGTIWLPRDRLVAAYRIG